MSEVTYPQIVAERVTRIEIISANGRVFSLFVEPGVELSFQDDARTLKLFVGEETEPQFDMTEWNAPPGRKERARAFVEQLKVEHDE